jgi:hypothetical protein
MYLLPNSASGTLGFSELFSLLYQADPAPGHERPVHHLALTLH